MAQTRTIGQRFNPRQNRSHFLWLLLGIVSFIGSIIGITFAILETRHPHGVQGTVVRIDVSDSMFLPPRPGIESGAIRVVWGFDSDNNVLGSSSLDTSIKSTGSETIPIDQNLNHTAKARYIDIISGEDAICISAIHTTFPSGETRTWYGDVGAACGHPWGYGAIYYSMPNGNGFYAKCVWMSMPADRSVVHDAPNPITVKQIKIDVLAYSNDATPGQIKKNPDLYCASTIFSKQDQHPIVDIPPGNTSTTPADRNIANLTPPKSVNHRTKRMAERLTISSDPGQSAAELCESRTSHGSDFVSTAEGLYCDMQEKMLYPLCNEIIQGECFDVNLYSVRSKRRDAGRRYVRVDGNELLVD